MKNFDEIISSGVLNINELENFRLQRQEIDKAKVKKVGLIAAGIYILLCIISVSMEADPMIVVFFVIGVLAFLFWWNNMKKKYVTEMKLNLVKKLINSIDDSFDYHPNSAVPRDSFENSNFVKGFNSYSGEDYFFGRFDDIPVELSQLRVAQKNDKSNVTLFDGIFVAAEFKHPFQGRCAIVPDTMEKTFGKVGRFLQNLNITRDSLIKIDNAEFEKQFAVYSNNIIEAQKLISPNITNYLLQLKSSIPNGVFFSYNEQKFYIGLFNRHDLFQLSIKTEINEVTLRKYYDEIFYILNIVLNFYAYLEENVALNLNNNL